jgi:hypothetical protein
MKQRNLTLQGEATKKHKKGKHAYKLGEKIIVSQINRKRGNIIGLILNIIHFY